MRIEVELYPLYWIEMDPRDLYDDRQISLADRLASGAVTPDQLDGTYWWTFDLTQPAKQINVIQEEEDTSEKGKPLP
jgi:hypothetical protein